MTGNWSPIINFNCIKYMQGVWTLKSKLFALEP